MPAVIEEKINALASAIAQIERDSFLRFLSYLFTQLEKRNHLPFLDGLMSPFRQLFYAAHLSVHAPTDGTIVAFAGPDWPDHWDTIRLSLIDIENYYIEQMMPADLVNESEVMQRILGGVTFMNYFFNGQLSWQEQEIERIQRIFPFLEKELWEEYKISLNDFVVFYLRIIGVMAEQLNSAIRPLKNPEILAAFKEFQVSGKVSPEEIKALGPEMKRFFGLLTNPGHIAIYTPEIIADKFISVPTACTILNLISCSHDPKDKHDYYTSNNTLLAKPIYRQSNGTYLVLHSKQVLAAVYEWLMHFGLQKQKDVYRQRDQFLELKVAEVFKRFFGKGVHIHQSYSIDKTSEQDILLLYKDTALIIEVKAGGYREPLRDTLKAYSRIKSDFKKTIQYGFDQCMRVQKKFQTALYFSIYDKKGDQLYVIRSAKYTKVFSIVVTLERFGFIQSDLSAFLQLPDDQDYPWSIPVDDLETFLIYLKKRSGAIQDFIQFLEYRQGYHGHLYCGDEMEMCAYFLKKPKMFKDDAFKENGFMADPRSTHVFEEDYKTGLGLTNEIYWKEKKDKSIGYF